jgi:hypothetical protein
MMKLYFAYYDNASWQDILCTEYLALKDTHDTKGVISSVMQNMHFGRLFEWETSCYKCPRAPSCQKEMNPD